MIPLRSGHEASKFPGAFRCTHPAGTGNIEEADVASSPHASFTQHAGRSSITGAVSDAPWQRAPPHITVAPLEPPLPEAPLAPAFPDDPPAPPAVPPAPAAAVPAAPPAGDPAAPPLDWPPPPPLH